MEQKYKLGDPQITEEQRQEKIINFDNERKHISNKIKRHFACKFADNYTKRRKDDTEIIGISNLEKVKNEGGFITSNHFNIEDTTIPRYAINKIGKKNHLEIIVEETNVFMTGLFGFLMNNCRTIPISQSKNYMAKKFMNSIKFYLEKKHFILIYPEMEMWPNYRKPRPLNDGAYHLAAKFNKPIIPCFTKIDLDKNKNLKYTFYIGDAIYPDKNKTLKENIEEIRKKDYDFKVKTYEKSYNKKLDYKFEKSDIAGL